MQFNVVALALAAMAAVVSAETVTVYECGAQSTAAASTVAPASSAGAAGVASPTIGSTGGVTAASPTGSPIAYATGAASMNGVSAFGMIVAGGVALFL